ncbi:MAG TPA: nucleotide exchange factor GrpE [Pyrinomonadaceae bacterium]
MMVNRKEQKSNRIPIHFVDDDKVSKAASQTKNDDSVEARSGEGDLSPEEIGRGSSYEDETDAQRRIDRGQERDDEAGRERADDSDAAGGPPPNEMPERREDKNQAAPNSANSTRDAASNSQQASDPEATGPVRAELIATRAELRRVEAQRDELRDALARRQADFENYRKRVERDRAESYNRLVGDVVSKLLPVLDNLRRALAAESSVQASESEEFRHFLQGVELIYKQLTGVLEGLGLQPVEAVGQRFDPHVHEAVITEQTEEYEPDTVIQELVPGYRLGEKLLRPAIVKVATR